MGMESLAALTSLGEKEIPQTCLILGLNGHTMQLKSSRHLTIGSPVKVEADDTLTLGEISYCRPDGDGYMVTVAVMQALHHVAEMSRLARALVG